MIKHFILLSAEFDTVDDTNDEDYGMSAVKIDFEHGVLLSTFGGVAYDTDKKVWLSPSQLSNDESNNDSIFLNLVSHALTGSEPD